MIGRLERIYACGNYGDQIVARDSTACRCSATCANMGPICTSMYTNGSARRPARWREQPENPEYLNPAYNDLDQLRRQYGRYQAYLDGVEINYKVAGSKGKIYLSAQGYVLPCCWHGAVFSEASMPERRPFAELVERLGGSEALDARIRGLRSVVESELFQSAIPASWDCKSVTGSKLAICALNCGAGYDPLDQQRD